MRLAVFAEHVVHPERSEKNGVRHNRSDRLDVCHRRKGFAVSVRTVAKWVRRFKEGGVAALEDASSRPGVAPHQTSPGRWR